MNQWALLLSTFFELFEKTFSGVQRLVALFVIALFVTLFLSKGAWAGVLFQSPTSPPPEEVAPAQAEPFAPNEEPEDPFAPSQPQETFEEQPQPQAPPEIIEEPPVEAESNEPVPVEEAVDPNQPDPEAGSPVVPEQQAGGDAPALQPPAAEPRPLRLERNDGSADAEKEGSQNFILDQAELIDTVVVSTAYIWLCCGIGLFLLIPLVFLFLQIRGRTKIVREENY